MISSAQYAIAATAVKVASAKAGHQMVHLVPIGNTTVYIGGTSAVTSSTGYALNKTVGDHDIYIGPGDELWAICAGEQTETLTVLIAE